MKPLFRWVIGPVTNAGLRVFRHSVQNVLSLYGDRFDYLVCHNQIDPARLSNLGVPLFSQDHLREGAEGYHVSWKLFPVRCRKASHELVMDSDIVLFDPLREIEDFLTSDCSLTYQGAHGLHGSYDNQIPVGMRMNSGIFGMPPNFDIDLTGKAIDGDFDEQGLVASSLLGWPSVNVIPLTTIPIIERTFDIQPYLRLRCVKGFHFVGVNRSDHHPQYERWIRAQISLM